jgi:beta-lactamase superfamily II metal-dependent hydrolase
MKEDPRGFGVAGERGHSHVAGRMPAEREEDQGGQERDVHAPGVGPGVGGLQEFFSRNLLQADWGVVDIPGMHHALLSMLLFEPTPAGLHFVDVGQGSAMLAVGPEGDIVAFDSGPPSGAEPLLRAIDGRGIDLWIHTHHDADHLGGFARVLAGFDGRWPSDDDVRVDRLWDRGDEALPSTDAFALYWTLAADRRTPAPTGTHAIAAGITIEVLELDPPPADAPENDRGLALCLELDGLRVLIPGDLAAERVILAASACGPVDVLWASHHGGADGLTSEVLALADPTVVVVSAGRDNGYCHPAASTLATLHEHEVGLLDAAGAGPIAECPSLLASFGPRHRLIGGDLWIASDGATLLGMPGGGWSPW